MKFFSEFCLKGESVLFEPWIDAVGSTAVAGFGLGAMDAFAQALSSKSRVDRVLLFSPAKSVEPYKGCVKKDRIDILSLLAIYGDNQNLKLKSFLSIEPIDRLDRLSSFVWSTKEIERLVGRGVKIELFVGSKDRLAKDMEIYDLFEGFATRYLCNGAGHFLEVS